MPSSGGLSYASSLIPSIEKSKDTMSIGTSYRRAKFCIEPVRKA